MDECPWCRECGSCDYGLPFGCTCGPCTCAADCGHPRCKAAARNMPPAPDALTPVYDWIVNGLGFPIDFCTEDKPDWLDIRRLAAAWMAREATEAEAGLERDASVDSYVDWLLYETNWNRAEVQG